MTQTMEPQATEAQGTLPRVSHWIDNKIVPSTSGKSRPVYNPATGAQTKTVDIASVAEIDAAVASAKAAFPMWRATSLATRADTAGSAPEHWERHSP